MFCWCVAGRVSLGFPYVDGHLKMRRTSGRSFRCKIQLRTMPRPQPIGASGILLGKVGYIRGKVGCTRG